MSTAAETWDAIYRSGRAQRTWPSEDVVRFVARRLGPSSGIRPYAGTVRVLEAGCGNGSNLWHLSKCGFQVTGMDGSEEALLDARDLCRQHGADAGLVTADIRELDPQMPVDAFCVASGYRIGGTLGVYDAVIDCRASQHVRWSEHAPTYRRYFDLLKPGGWLFLLHLDAGTEPDAQQAGGRVDGELATWANIGAGVYANNGLVCMPPPTMLDIVLRVAGFRVERHEEIRRLCDDQMASHTAIDAQRPDGV